MFNEPNNGDQQTSDLSLMIKIISQEDIAILDKMIYIRIVKYLGFDEYHSFEYVIGTGSMKNILLFDGEKSEVPIGKLIEVSTTMSKKHPYCLVDDELYIRKKQQQTEEQLLEKLSRGYDRIVSSFADDQWTDHDDYSDHSDWSNQSSCCWNNAEHQQMLDRLDLIYSRTVP